MLTPGVRYADFTVTEVEPVQLSFPIESLGSPARATREFVAQLGIHGKAHHSVRHCPDVARGVGEPIFSVAQVIGNTAGGRRA